MVDANGENDEGVAPGETNNQNQGDGVDKDDVTYFPWELDDDRFVTTLDAIFVINRLGGTFPPTDSRADFDGDGFVTTLDAIA